MCYAFALFCCSFIIAVVFGVCLSWASSRPPRSRFATAHIWSGVICLFEYMATVSTTAAICILSVTILQLRFASEGSGKNADSPPYIDVRPAAHMTFICVGMAALYVLIALVFYFLANGWDRFVDVFLGRRERGPGLNDHIV